MKKVVAITPNNKTDYLASTIIEGLQLLNYEIIATDKGNGITHAWSDSDIIMHAKDAEYILVFFGKIRGNNPTKRYLLDRINAKYKTAYIDGSEWTCTALPESNQVAQAKKDPLRRRGNPWLDAEMFAKANWYFKRECYPQDISHGIIPLPFGVMKKDVVLSTDNHNKDIDVLCSFGQLNDGLRSEAVEICKKLAKELPDKNFCLQTGMNTETYKNILSRSRIIIDAWGGGDCCARIWEAVGVGACCFRQKYKIIIPNDFVNEQQIVNYTSASELENKLREYLSDNNKDKVTSIGINGQKHAMQFHTSVERTRYMLEKMK